MKCKTCKSHCAWAGKEESEHGLCLVGYTPITNADCIRGMTDDELAKYLCKLIREATMMMIPSAHYSNANIEELNQNWLDWLRQEVVDE